MRKALPLCVMFLFLIMIADIKAKDESSLNIIPKPSSIKVLSGTFNLDYKTKVVAPNDETRKIAGLLNDYLLKTYGFKLEVVSQDKSQKNAVFLSNSGDGLPSEGYRLSVNKNAIKVVGKDAGLLYAYQTFIQLLPVNKKVPFKIPCVEITDEPRFQYRGIHLDVARHFFSVEFIKKYLDLMTQYKFNTFHWHLTEDQGWRIEIKKYPKLTEIGSKRKETVKGHQLSSQGGDGVPYGGFYTQDQIKDVVKYAQARYITIIPEIEMPGHSTAAIAAHPELACTSGPFEVVTGWGIFKDIFCPKEETFKFLEDVLSEVVELFPGPYVHIGGDEAPKDRWKESQIAQDVIKREGLKDEHELQSYFIQRIEKFLNSKGKRIIGWDEILEGGLAPNATVMSWRGEAGGIEAAKQKHNVVMTPTTYVYFDYGQGDPKTEPLNIGGYLTLDKVYNYDPVPKELDPNQRKYILGAQGNLWTEYIKTPEAVEYMIFPRMIALSEVNWTNVESKNYKDFLKRLSFHLERLEKQKVNFRIPEPIGWQKAVTTKEEEVIVNLDSPVQNSKIYYTLDGTGPTTQSKLYDKPLKIRLAPDEKININLIVVTPGGRQSVVYGMILEREKLNE